MILRAPFLNRRQFARHTALFGLAAASRFGFAEGGAGDDPWPSADLMQPDELAKLIKNSTGSQPRIICVTFPILYRQRHIAGATFAGPGGKPEGVAALHSALAEVDPSSTVVLYCGCCPMTKCPNIRPAYIEAKQSSVKQVRVLSLPTNLHTDWVAKGYPVST